MGDCWVLEPGWRAPSWRLIAPMSCCRQNVASVSFGDDLWMCGGAWHRDEGWGASPTTNCSVSLKPTPGTLLDLRRWGPYHPFASVGVYPPFASVGGHIPPLRRSLLCVRILFASWQAQRSPAASASVSVSTKPTQGMGAGAPNRRKGEYHRREPRRCSDEQGVFTESVSCKSFVEPQIIEICENIHAQRDIKPGPGGNPPGKGLESLCAWIFSQISMI